MFSSALLLLRARYFLTLDRSRNDLWLIGTENCQSMFASSKSFFLSKTFRLSLYCLLMKGLSLITLGWNAIWQNSGWPAIFLTWVFPKSAKRGTQGCSGCRWVGWKRIPRTGNIDVCFLLPLPLLLLLACWCLFWKQIGQGGCTAKQIETLTSYASLSKGPQMTKHDVIFGVILQLRITKMGKNFHK